jgi:hypothetical protein
MIIVRPEHSVVERLGVIGVGASFEQQPSKCERMRVSRFDGRPLFTFTERPGHGGERGREPMP